MIPVVVGENHFLHARKIHIQIACILQYRVGMSSGIQQNTMTIGFNQRGKTPLSQTRRVSHKHGGEQSDFKSADLCCRRDRALDEAPSQSTLRDLRWKTEKNDSGDDGYAI